MAGFGRDGESGNRHGGSSNNFNGFNGSSAGFNEQGDGGFNRRFAYDGRGRSNRSFREPGFSEIQERLIRDAAVVIAKQLAEQVGSSSGVVPAVTPAVDARQEVNVRAPEPVRSGTTVSAERVAAGPTGAMSMVRQAVARSVTSREANGDASLDGGQAARAKKNEGSVLFPL
jgi:hypothetical protein